MQARVVAIKTPSRTRSSSSSSASSSSSPTEASGPRAPDDWDLKRRRRRRRRARRLTVLQQQTPAASSPERAHRPERTRQMNLNQPSSTCSLPVPLFLIIWAALELSAVAAAIVSWRAERLDVPSSQPSRVSQETRSEGVTLAESDEAETLFPVGSPIRERPYCTRPGLGVGRPLDRRAPCALSKLMGSSRRSAPSRRWCARATHRQNSPWILRVRSRRNIETSRAPGGFQLV